MAEDSVRVGEPAITGIIKVPNPGHMCGDFLIRKYVQNPRRGRLGSGIESMGFENDKYPFV